MSRGNIGLGFAIPINARTREIIETVKSGKKVVRGRLGISVGPVSDTVKKVYDTDHGVFVNDITPGSAADKAGFQRQDIILSYDGRPVTSQDEFVNWVQATKPGTKVTLDILRDGKPLRLSAVVEVLEAGPQPTTTESEEPQKLGLTVQELPEGKAGKIGVNGGVQVRALDPVSDGVRAGIQTGDVILKINRQPVTDVAGYRAIVNKLKPGDPVVFIVWRETDRQGGGEFVTLELPEVSGD